MNDSDEETKRLFRDAAKQAIKEWMTEQEAMIGRGAIRLIICGMVVALTWFLLWKAGWTPPVKP
jgi:hypothetical protein